MNHMTRVLMLLLHYGDMELSHLEVGSNPVHVRIAIKECMKRRWINNTSSLRGTNPWYKINKRGKAAYLLLKGNSL